MIVRFMTLAERYTIASMWPHMLNGLTRNLRIATDVLTTVKNEILQSVVGMVYLRVLDMFNNITIII